MRTLFSLIFVMLLISCKNDSDTKANGITNDNIEIQIPKTFQFPELTENAREAVFEWKNFQELENNMAYINQGNLKNIASETKRMKAVADTLMLYPPRVLQSVPVLSRMRVLRTRIYLLDQVLHQRGIGVEVVEKNLEETNLAFYNLLLQINEKFEKAEIDAITRTQENILRSQNTNVKDSL